MPKNNKFADDGLVTDFAVHVKGRVASLEDRGDGWDGSVTDLTNLIQTEGRNRANAISALGDAVSADLQGHADYAEGRYAKKADLVPPVRRATIRHVEGSGGTPTYEVIRVSAGALNLKKIYQPLANAQGIAQNHGKGVTWDSFRDLTRKYGYTAIVNADSWVGTDGGTWDTANFVRPVGLQIIDGRAIQNFGLGGSDLTGSDLEALVVNYDGTVVPARASDGKTAQDYVNEGAYFSVGYGPILCENGVLRNWQNDVRFSGFATNVSGRTIFGQAANGDFIFIVVKGVSGVSGIAGNAMGQLAVQEGCRIAVVLDGGGSTQVTWKGYNIRPSTDVEGFRRVNSMLVIAAPESNDYDTGDIEVELDGGGATNAVITGPLMSGKPSAFLRQVNERVHFTLNASTEIPFDAWHQLRSTPLDRIYESAGRVEMRFGMFAGSEGTPITASFANDTGALSVRKKISDTTSNVCGTMTWAAQFA